MMHLDRDTYEALLRGTLPPPEAEALAEHLRGECETCTAFLASPEVADRLDGRVDAAIAAAFPPAAPPADDLAFARIWRRVHPVRGGRRRALAVAAAVAVAAGLAAVVVRTGPGAPPGLPAWDGTKGPAAAIRATLRAARVDGGDRVAAVRPGESLSRGARLTFELEADRPVRVILLRVGAEGAGERIWAGPVGPGRTIVTVGGKVAAFSLATLDGAQRFAAIFGDAAAGAGPLEAAAARMTADAGYRDGPLPESLTEAHIDIVVH